MDGEQCKAQFPDLIAPTGPSFKTVALTLALIALATILEVIVHLSDRVAEEEEEEEAPAGTVTTATPGESAESTTTIAGSTDGESPSAAAPASTSFDAPQDHPSDLHTSAQDSTELSATPAKQSAKQSAKQPPAFRFCTPHPSPTTRANRLTTATILLIPFTAIFIFLLRATAPPVPSSSLPATCHLPLGYPQHRNTLTLTLFIILPFVLGCAAWARAFTDCLLVRWDKALGYWPDGAVFPQWPVCAPVAWALVGAVVPIVVVGLMIRFGVLCLMGRTDLMGFKGRRAERVEEGDIEMAGAEGGEGDDGEEGEESRLLGGGRDMEGADIGEAEEDESPPAYDADWKQRGVDEGSETMRKAHTRR